MALNESEQAKAGRAYIPALINNVTCLVERMENKEDSFSLLRDMQESYSKIESNGSDEEFYQCFYFCGETLGKITELLYSEKE